MSEMGKYNLELQEQANELGFSTTQEALDAGFMVSNGKLYLSPHKSTVESVLDGLDEVLEYLKEGCDSEECDRTTFMIASVRKAEQFLIDNFNKLKEK